MFAAEDEKDEGALDNGVRIGFMPVGGRSGSVDSGGGIHAPFI